MYANYLTFIGMIVRVINSKMLYLFLVNVTLLKGPYAVNVSFCPDWDQNGPTLHSLLSVFLVLLI